MCARSEDEPYYLLSPQRYPTRVIDGIKCRLTSTAGLELVLVTGHTLSVYSLTSALPLVYRMSLFVDVIHMQRLLRNTPNSTDLIVLLSSDYDLIVLEWDAKNQGLVIKHRTDCRHINGMQRMERSLLRTDPEDQYLIGCLYPNMLWIQPLKWETKMPEPITIPYVL